MGTEKVELEALNFYKTTKLYLLLYNNERKNVI